MDGKEFFRQVRSVKLLLSNLTVKDLQINMTWREKIKFHVLNNKDEAKTVIYIIELNLHLHYETIQNSY